MAQQHSVLGVDLFEQPSHKYHYTKVSRLSPELDELFATNSFDAVINAAGSGNVPYSMSHPVLDFEANSLDTIRVLDAIRKHQPTCKYLHLSSAAVYGNPGRLPVQETDPTHPLSAYGWHKLISELLCQEYSSVYGLKTVIARPFSVYGPGLKKQMFWDIYQKIRQQKDAIQLFGKGTESRDYIHIDDLIIALDCLLKKGGMSGEVYNIASGDETTVRQAVDQFIQHLKINVICKFDGTVRPGDPLNWRADVTKIEKLGFKPSISMTDGLAKLAQWIVNY